MSERAATLIEALIATMLIVVVAAGVSVLFVRAYANHDAILLQNQVQRQARAAIDLLVDEARALPQPASAWGGSTTRVIVETNAYGSVFGYEDDSGLSSSWTISRNGSNQLVYSYNGSTKARVNNITSFQIVALTRQKSVDGSLNWVAYSGAVPSDKKPKLCAVRVSATASRDGYACTLRSIVKLRNQLYWTVAPPEVW